MPCTSYMPGEAEAIQRAELDKVTRILCTAMRNLENRDLAIPEDVLDREGREWWAEHKRRDEARLRREAEESRQQQLRQEALMKLTPEEQEALRVR